MKRSGGSSRQKSSGCFAAFSPKRRSRRQRQIPDGPRLEIIPVSSYSSPPRARPRPKRHRSPVQATPVCELKSDPISTAQFSTPRPDPEKRLVSTFLHLPSAKKRKFIRVKPRAPHLLPPESRVGDISNIVGLSAASPARVESILPSRNRGQNEPPEKGIQSQNSASLGTRADDVALRDPTEESRPALTPTENETYALVTPVQVLKAMKPAGTSEERVSDHLKRYGVASRVRSSQALASAKSDDAVNSVVSLQRPWIDLVTHNGKLGKTIATSPVVSTVQPSNTKSRSHPPKPQRFSISSSPGILSQMEPGLLALHPTFEVQTCRTEDLGCQTQSDVEGSGVQQKSHEQSDQGIVTHLSGSGNDAQHESSLPSNADVHITEQPHMGPSQVCSNTNHAVIVSSESPPGTQNVFEPVNLVQEAEQADSLRLSASVAKTPARTRRTPRSSASSLCSLQNSSYRNPRDLKILVSKTPLDQRPSLTLVEETPPSLSDLRHREDGPVSAPSCKNAVTPAVGTGRVPSRRQQRQTPPVFAGFTPESACASRAKLHVKRAHRSPGARWSYRHGTHPVCAQTPPNNPKTPAPLLGPSPAIVLGTVLRRAQTPKEHSHFRARQLFSAPESVTPQTQFPWCSARTLSASPRVSGDNVLVAKTAEADSGLVLVPETCVPENRTPDAVCQRALSFVNARVARALRGGPVDESDDSTEPPPPEVVDRHRPSICLEGSDEQVPRTAVFRESVPSGALAFSSDSDSVDD